MLEMEMEDMDRVAQEAIFSSSSDEEEAGRRSNREGKSPNKSRDFLGAHNKVVEDYFKGRESKYDEKDFERRFRCPRTVFNEIHDALMGTDPFVHKKDCTGKWGVYPLVKLVACFRYIAYGDSFDREDENLQIGESTLQDYCKDFSKLVVEKFGKQYLNRCPNSAEREAISSAMAVKGFPGCLASWDCKHFDWKNCPIRLQGQHQGHAEGGKTTLILEAIADHRKYFWYINFGDAGSLNDLNVLDKSSIVGAMIGGRFDISIEEYEINETVRDWMYFLVDGIYPEWAIFVSTFTNKDTPRKKAFATEQEKVRKDIECAFGILLQRFHILQRPLRGWYLEDIKNLLQCCAIIHNMVVEARFSLQYDEEEARAAVGHPLFGKAQLTADQVAQEGVDLFAARAAAFNNAMRSSALHFDLKADLVEHINSFES